MPTETPSSGASPLPHLIACIQDCLSDRSHALRGNAPWDAPRSATAASFGNCTRVTQSVTGHIPRQERGNDRRVITTVAHTSDVDAFSFLNRPPQTALHWCERLHPPHLSSPFWFESSRQSWQNATVSRQNCLFQGFNASFRSLGLVFAFSLYQRMPQACALLQKRS